ncbi:MAG: SpoIIE family protein phosphatase [Actinomycetota bacterium]|nr:SpoIIE family protein phosphatase [Actinomycetota bacterium]
MTSPIPADPRGLSQPPDPETAREGQELLYLRQFFYQCPVGLFEVDDGGAVRMVNPAAVRMLAPVIGSGDLSQLFPLLSQLAPEMVAAIRQDPSAMGPLAAGQRILVRAGAHAAAYLEMQAVRVAAGRVMLALQDVSAEHRLALREREIAVELQLAMLGHADEVPGMPVGVTYRAADAELQVGGDWYDVIKAGDGRAALVVGDAVGHTLGATIAMGQLRSAIRATARFCRDPGALLRHADAIAEQTDGAECCTVAYAVLDLTSGELTHASAGHPPILVLHADGTTAYLAGGRGLPLGIVATDRTSDLCQLTAGDAVIMYTDGLYERRDQAADERLAELAALATRFRGLPPTELSLALTDAMVGRAGPQDDICVLVAAPDIGARTGA